MTNEGDDALMYNEMKEETAESEAVDRIGASSKKEP